MNGQKINLVIDFDSTFIRLEALDELAGIALSKNKDKEKIVKEIKDTTILGMEGKITFPESLARRFKLLSANKDHVRKLIGHLEKNISKSVKKNKIFFQENSKNIYIISGGFLEYIYPVVENYGIRRKNILANKFIFDRQGNIIGFDKKRDLAKVNGKVKAVKSKKIEGDIWVVGDGYTDYQIKEAKLAKKFVAYCENVRRENVVEKADDCVDDFGKLLKIIREN